MNAVGLSRDEFTIISIVSPLVAVLGPLIAAPLADRLAGGFGGTPRSKTGRYLRVMISICLALATILYWLLLAVPRIVIYQFFSFQTINNLLISATKSSQCYIYV